MQPFFQKFLKKIAAAYPKTQMLTLAGCLDTSAPPLGEGMYIDSENPTSLKNADSYGVKDRVEELLKKNPGMPLFLIGHSYGGWMSMFLAEELSGPPNLRGLFTIDPIGPECDALGVVLGDSACHEAPTDRNNKTIQKRAEVWANFYQDTDSWISSSAIKEAKNTHYEAEWGPHSDIAERGDLWSSLEHSVNASLAK
jgi:pimeloyl-ACP methyl ester carboxylesterase